MGGAGWVAWAAYSMPVLSELFLRSCGWRAAHQAPPSLFFIFAPLTKHQDWVAWVGVLACPCSLELQCRSEIREWPGSKAPAHAQSLRPRARVDILLSSPATTPKP